MIRYITNEAHIALNSISFNTARIVSQFTKMRATTILAIVAIVAALGAVTSFVPIHQVSATTPNPGSTHVNPNHAAVQHACANPTAAFHSNIHCTGQ
jgi:hypothetical protein